MAWVTCSIRSMSLLNRKFDMNMQLMKISQRLMDLQTFGSNIANGAVSASAMASCPSSMFGTQSAYLSQSAQVAYQSASVKTNDYLQRIGMINQGTNGQYQLAAEGQNSQTQPYLIFNEIYKQELKECANKLTEKINAEEKQLTQKKLTLETQLKAVEAEYESIQKTIDDDIKNSAIKLA